MKDTVMAYWAKAKSLWANLCELWQDDKKAA